MEFSGEDYFWVGVILLVCAKGLDYVYGHKVVVRFIVFFLVLGGVVSLLCAVASAMFGQW